MPKKQPWSSYGETIHTRTQQSGCHSSKLYTGVSFGTCSFEILADSLWHECMGLCHSSMGALLWAGNTASWQPRFLLSGILDFTHLSSKSQINKFCGLIFHAKACILSRNFYFIWGFSPQIFYPLTWILHFHDRTSCSWSVAKVTSDFLWPHGLCSPSLLCLWDFPGKNTGGGCHFFLQGIFSTQGSNLCLHCQADSYWTTREVPTWRAHMCSHLSLELLSVSFLVYLYWVCQISVYMWFEDVHVI